jgi:hypothetical protein
MYKNNRGTSGAKPAQGSNHSSRTGGGYGGQLPGTDAPARPIYTCHCGAQSSAGCCPRGHSG